MPKNKKNRFYKIISAFIIILLLSIAGLWVSGQIVFKQATSLIGLQGEKYQAKAGIIIYVPLAKILWGKDISVKRLGGDTETEFKIASLYAKKSPLSWHIKFSGLNCQRSESWVAKAGLFQFQVTYEPEIRELSFTDGHFDGFKFANQHKLDLKGEMKSLSFEKLSCGAGFANEPRDWNIKIKNLAMDEMFFFASIFDKSYQMRPVNFFLSGHASSEDWALDLLLKRDILAESKAQLEENEEDSTWAKVLWGKAKEKINVREFLDFSLLKLEAGGPWKKDEQASETLVKSKLTLKFPKLYEMSIEGESAAPNTKDAKAWLTGCYNRLSSSPEEKTDCLALLSFQKLKSHYIDLNAMSFMDKVKSVYQQGLQSIKSRFNKKNSFENYALPLMGVELTQWLTQNKYPNGSEGDFLFKDEGSLKPFSKEFYDRLSEGKMNLEFKPSAK